MRWLVDGYNVIRRDPDLRGRERESLEAGRTALLRLLARVARESREDFVVVFDGARVRGGPASGGQVEVVFSRPPETADEVLIRLATRWREGAVLVSSDRAVRNAARRAGSAVLEVEQFLSAVTGEESDAEDEEEEPDSRRPAKGGNPRRLSRDERAAQRALGRLRRR